MTELQWKRFREIVEILPKELVQSVEILFQSFERLRIIRDGTRTD